MKRTLKEIDDMNIQALSEKIEATILTKQADTQREVSSGYTCDLLSWVMAHGREGMAWITVQTHMNVIAVATLVGTSAVIICEDSEISDEVIETAKAKSVNLLRSDKPIYEMCVLLARVINE